jgi:hypothetical protein
VIERTRNDAVETRYYISSRHYPGNERKLFDAVRNHWGIENKIHYPRDVTYNEDHCRIRTPHHARVMCSLRNLAISLYQLQDKVFSNYRFKSNPAMHEYFASSSRQLFQWMTQCKCFLL